MKITVNMDSIKHLGHSAGNAAFGAAEALEAGSAFRFPERIVYSVTEKTEELLAALRRVADGSLSPEEMLGKLKAAPFEDIGVANIDYHRAVRQGASEVIYGKSKTPEQILAICQHMAAKGEENILILCVKLMKP